jgi:hypothetical protein
MRRAERTSRSRELRWWRASGLSRRARCPPFAPGPRRVLAMEYDGDPMSTHGFWHSEHRTSREERTVRLRIRLQGGWRDSRSLAPGTAGRAPPAAMNPSNSSLPWRGSGRVSVQCLDGSSKEPPRRGFAARERVPGSRGPRQWEPKPETRSKPAGHRHTFLERGRAGWLQRLRISSLT